MVDAAAERRAAAAVALCDATSSLTKWVHSHIILFNDIILFWNLKYISYQFFLSLLDENKFWQLDQKF